MMNTALNAPVAKSKEEFAAQAEPLAEMGREHPGDECVLLEPDDGEGYRKGIFRKPNGYQYSALLWDAPEYW